jgi:hypothetical protein
MATQTQSQRNSNLKLSAAQIAMLRNELAPAGSEGRSFVSNISTGNALITKGMAERVKGRYSANTIVITAAGCEAIGLDYNDVISAQLKKAAKREMIAYVAEESVVATEAELIEWAGWEADPQYLIDAYIAVGGEMIVEETPATEEASSEDELPAKMPMPEIVDADTAPVMDAPTAPAKTDYAEGQTVAFYDSLSNVDNTLYTGVIGELKSSARWGDMAFIDHITSEDERAYHLTPRYVPLHRISKAISAEKAIEMVQEYDELALLRKMAGASLAWEQAYFAPRSNDPETRREQMRKIDQLSKAHDALVDEHLAMVEAIIAPRLPFPQNAPQTPHNGTPAPVDDVQAFSANLDQRKPEIASEPFAPVNATNDHPLALIQPGSVASKTDWDAQQAKRDAQHAEAKARVEALNGVYQAPVRKGIQMHSPEYLNQIFKQASGGAK